MSPPAAPVAPCWPSNVSDSGVTTPSTIWAIPPFRIVKGSSSPSKNTSVEDTHVDVVFVSKDGELEAVPVGGAATFRLRCVALSYKHSRRRFRILAQAAAPPAAAGLPPQVCATAVSQPFRSVARLPNEAKPEARAAPAAAACASFSSATSFSPPTSPQHSIASYGGESDASTAALELAQLREQLQLESADNAANKAAIAAQAEMLDVLSRQQAQILAELQRLRPGDAPAVVPGLGW